MKYLNLIAVPLGLLTGVVIVFLVTVGANSIMGTHHDPLLTVAIALFMQLCVKEWRYVSSKPTEGSDNA